MLPSCRTRNEDADFGAGAIDTDRPPGVGGGGRREGSQSALRAPVEVRGRQDRIRGDVGAGLLGELDASIDQAASGPPPTSESKTTRADAIFIK